ncbi:hypothetical protein NXS19_011359 [Fusarium pseudograminearum]|nr:hypothetical protein NXS19_011359 [Fusarium pseudograminearum]
MVALKSTLLVILALGNEAFAATTGVICATKLGTVSVASNKIPRATVTVKNQITVIKKVIRKVNIVVVPQPRTTTETQISKTTVTTDADPDVETAISTITDTQTTTITQFTTTTSTTVTSTTVTSYSTSTIKAPDNFKFLLNSGGYVPKLKGRGAKPILPRGTTSQYPQRVDCTKSVPSTTIKTVSTTVKGVRVTLQPKTKTKVVVKTETVTSTNYPPKVTKTNTITVSPTVTVHDTVTRQAIATDTVTVQTILPADPYYEACGSDAFLKTANDGNSVNLAIPFSTPYTQQYYFSADTMSSYLCCVQCMKSPKCFMSQTYSGSITCYNYLSTTTDNTCPNGQIQWASYYGSEGPAFYTYANGPCGFMNNIGFQGIQG